MDWSKAVRVIGFGALYAVAFLGVMAGVVLFLLPDLHLSRITVLGLFCLSIAFGACMGIRQGCKKEL
jgi:hypothetical protein